MLSYTSVVSSSVAVSSSRMGDSSELVVLWESVVGRALFCFLVPVVLVVFALLIIPVCTLPGEECCAASCAAGDWVVIEVVVLLL